MNKLYDTCMRTVLSLLLVILPILGIADASYLTYEKLAGRTPPCSVGSDCGAVLNSPYSTIGPIPLSALGLLFYLSVFMVASLNLLEFDLGNWFKQKKFNRLRFLQPIDLLVGLSTFGLFFSAFLVLLMGVVIKAWCQYCLLSALISATIWLTTLIYSQILDRSPFMAKRVWSSVVGGVYREFLKPVFFLFDPEFIHDALTLKGRFLGHFGFTRALSQTMFGFSHPVLAQTFDGIRFPNPVGLSAGFDYDGDLTGILPSVGFGFHTIGTVTLQAYDGNQPPRLGRFPKSQALLVNKGLKSMGAASLIKKLETREFAIPVGISIASTNTLFSNTKEQILDMLQCFVLFEKSNVKHAYYELNISCPNTFGGEPFTSSERLEVLLHCTDALQLSRPLYLKMPIDQNQAETAALLSVADRHRVDGVIFGNLTKDKNNPSVEASDREHWKTSRGNLSGKPTWERSNAHIAYTKKTYGNRFTIIGTGGIFSGKDALEKMRLGADLVQLITGMIFQGPQLIGQINQDIAEHWQQ